MGEFLPSSSIRGALHSLFSNCSVAISFFQRRHKFITVFIKSVCSSLNFFYFVQERHHEIIIIFSQPFLYFFFVHSLITSLFDFTLLSLSLCLVTSALQHARFRNLTQCSHTQHRRKSNSIDKGKGEGVYLPENSGGSSTRRNFDVTGRFS